MHSRKAQPEHRPDPFVQHKAGSQVCAGMLPYVQANPASLLNAAVPWQKCAGTRTAHLSTPSCWKMPMQTPIRSSRLGAQ